MINMHSYNSEQFGGNGKQFDKNSKQFAENSRNKENQGMALVTVLVFSAVAMLVITAAISLSIMNSISSRQMLQGQQALLVAESGAENALLMLLRNPDYSGEILTMQGGTATITTSGSNPKTIEVQGDSGSASKTLEIKISYVGGAMKITSWQEKF